MKSVIYSCATPACQVWKPAEKVWVVYYSERIFSWNYSQDVADDADRPHVGLGANGLVV